jgi:hypothetical protein
MPPRDIHIKIVFAAASGVPVAIWRISGISMSVERTVMVRRGKK